MDGIRNLSQFSAGQTGTITQITGTGPFFTRLRSLGVRPDSFVKVVQKAPFGGPLCIDISGSRFALPREEAQHILLNVG